MDTPWSRSALTGNSPCSAVSPRQMSEQLDFIRPETKNTLKSKTLTGWFWSIRSIHTACRRNIKSTGVLGKWSESWNRSGLWKIKYVSKYISKIFNSTLYEKGFRQISRNFPPPGSSASAADIKHLPNVVRLLSEQSDVENAKNETTVFNMTSTSKTVVSSPGCGGRIWTYDLRVMSPTSYQLLHSAI